MGLFERLKEGLAKTRTVFTERVGGALSRRKIDDSVYEELEDALLSADVGVTTTQHLLERLAREARRQKLTTADQLIPVLRELVSGILEQGDTTQSVAAQGLTVILVVGVNGAGKTTTIGKMAYRLSQEGKRVILAAGDTFRAAAIEQLCVWGERSGAHVVRQSTGSDPAAVIYDAIQAAQARKADVLICDTAGRLQNKAHLMAELEKMVRVIVREIPEAPHETLLVLDATTGQNAITQAKIFKDSARVTGIVLTKLDGTAKGGVVIAIFQELGLPVKWVTVGEQLDDLQPFSASAFSSALFAEPDIPRS
jgi:fused signal recognition particle receptor